LSSPTLIEAAAVSSGSEGLHLRLPATSANLGPGFDTLALALSLALEIDAMPAAEFRLCATGRHREICSALRRNLLLDVYQTTLAANGAALVPLVLDIHNEIPIGMGCGSSAAVRLAGIALANHFGQLGWARDRILNEAARLEGHPDNVAACWLGGFAVATTEHGEVRALSLAPVSKWRVLLAMPDAPLATVAARAVLPPRYDREDAVFNMQRTSLLTAAFAAGRGDLLQTAMGDRMHQPFRGRICPLLPRLLPLAGEDGILGIALSGAGPAVLLLVDEESPMERVRTRVAAALGDEAHSELIECGIEASPAIATAIRQHLSGDNPIV
jgi:homoserine kinase